MKTKSAIARLQQTAGSALPASINDALDDAKKLLKKYDIAFVVSSVEEEDADEWTIKLKLSKLNNRPEDGIDASDLQSVLKDLESIFEGVSLVYAKKDLYFSLFIVAEE